MEQTIWGQLPLLVRANSKDSVEHILRALWRTRTTGLDAGDRLLICKMLELQDDSDLDPLLVCLRILIRRCVYENISKDELSKLFPDEVSPELQRLLTILLQKFQKEWQQEVFKDQVSSLRLKAMTWNIAHHNVEKMNPMAVIDLKLQNDDQGESQVQFLLAKDSLEKMVKSMHSMRDQLSDKV